MLFVFSCLFAGCASRVESLAEALTMITLDMINLQKSTTNGDELPCGTEHLVCGRNKYEYCYSEGTSELSLSGGSVGTNSLTYATFSYVGGIKGGGFRLDTNVNCEFSVEIPYNATYGKVKKPFTIPTCEGFSCTAGDETFSCEEFKQALAKVDCAHSIFPKDSL